MAKLEQEYSQHSMRTRLFTCQIAYHNLKNDKSILKVEVLLRIAVILDKKIVSDNRLKIAPLLKPRHDPDYLTNKHNMK